jgi:hypothetical protein
MTNRSSTFPSCTGTIQPPPREIRPIPTNMPPHSTRLREQPIGRDGRAIKHIHSLHASEHFPVAGTRHSRASSGQTCNRRVQTRQTLIHMSKEQNPIPLRRPGRIRTTMARPPLSGLRSMLIRSAFPPRRRLPLWRWTVSNRRPPACKAGALPLSYTPRRNILMKLNSSFL